VKIKFIATALVLWITSASFAQDSTGIRSLGSFAFWTQSYAVSVRDDYAYVADRLNGIHVLDVSDKSHPIEVGNFAIPAETHGLSLAGEYLYVAAQVAGLYIFDISDPANPEIVGIQETRCSANGVTVDGEYAYVADAIEGLCIIDVSEPTHPSIVGQCDTPGDSYDVTISGHFAYVADYQGGLRIINISNPQQPTETGFYPGLTPAVAVVGRYAYMADVGRGFDVIDISNPADPIEVGNCVTRGNVFGVAIRDSLAYLAYYSGYGMGVVSISDPAHLTEIGGFDGGILSRDIDLIENYAFLASDNAGLTILNALDPTHIALEGSYYPLGRAGRFAVKDSIAVVCTGAHSFLLLDFSDPEHPVQLVSQLGAHYSCDVEIEGDFLYLADADNGLRVFDISTPIEAHEVAFISNAEWSVNGVELGNGFLYASWNAPGGGGIQVFDITDPVHITPGRYIYQRQTPTRLTIHGSYLYASYNNLLEIVEITEPTQPRLAGSCSVPGEALGIAVKDSIAYVATGAYGVRLIDVSDPEHPVECDSIATRSSAQDIVIEGDLAFVADYDSGLVILNVSRPDRPFIAGYAKTHGPATVLGLGQDHQLYVGELLYFGIYDYSEVTSVSPSPSPLTPYTLSLSLSPFPNPFNSSTTISYTLPKPGRYALDVVDIRGRLVTRLADGWKEAGSYRSILQGGELPSGTFVVRLEGGDASVVQKVELVK